MKQLDYSVRLFVEDVEVDGISDRMVGVVRKNDHVEHALVVR
jgi:hypothetical protein